MSDNALGKGLDALIQKPKAQSKTKKTSTKSKKTTNKSKKEDKPKVENINTFNLSEDKIQEIKNEIEKNPRISLWSAKSAACLRYLKKTTPEFSISSEASLILEEAIASKYPEIWELFDDL